MTVLARDEDNDTGSLTDNSYVTLYIGGKTVYKLPENGGSVHDNVEFGLNVKKGAIAKLKFNVSSYGANSYYAFQEFKLS